MTDTVLRLIGNAHIDPVWLWPWQEGFHEVKATFRSALDRMNEYSDFIFVASSAAFYEWVEQSDPSLFAEIRQRVAEGRWQIVGGWWIEPDCNLPGGESFVRQGLYGQGYFRNKFGVTATVGYAIDSFGHHGMLPQILLKSGLPYYVFMRPGPHEKQLPARLFWWEADDGSRVMAFQLPFEYLSIGQDFEPHLRRCAAEMPAPLDEFMCFYGVGNHGGGPTRANLECLRRLNGAPDLPQLVCSSPQSFFQAAEAKGWPLPVVHDELQHHASGCYAAHSGIKRQNRLAETRLLAAEKFSALAAWTTGQPYPADLGRAWKNVLFNQFHDLMAGTCLETAYDDARDLHGEAMAIADRALNLAAQSLAWNVRIEPQEAMTPIVVFNSNTWACRASVEVELNLNGDGVLLDHQGCAIPVQFVQPQATTTWRRRLSFVADLPPLGYGTYRLFSQAAAPAPARDDVPVAPFLENDHLRLEFDESGCLKRLYDKRTQAELLAGPAAQAVVIDDPSDTWSHGVFKFDRVVGVFRATHIECLEHGPVKSVVRVTSEYNRSKLIQAFTVYRDLDQIDVDVMVDWHEQLEALKLRFPLNLASAAVTREIPYGYIEQAAHTAVGEEEPMQNWVDVSGMSPGAGVTCGLSLLNDGKYSVDVQGSDIGLTVLRSPVYAHHMPATLQPGVSYPFMDQGVQRFRYALLPHSGSWQAAGTVRRAAELNQRPVVLIGTYHPQGMLAQRDSFIVVEPENIVVTVLKQAEDNDDLILRAYETTRVAAAATIQLPHWQRVIEAHFGPCEIKTWRIPRDPAQPSVETSLLEDS